MRKHILALGVTGALVAGGLALAHSPALAAVPATQAGNVTVLPTAPRMIAWPGTPLKKGETKTLAVGGQTFGGVKIPADATGVTLSVTVQNAAAAGKANVWTAGVGRPGTPTISFPKTTQTTTSAFVGLDSAGKMSVYSSVAADVLFNIQAYVAPVAAPQPPTPPVVKTIAKTERELVNVGGSFKARSKVVGGVTLAPGTYDARLTGTFVGFNNETDLAEGINVTGTMALTLGTEVKSDFSNNVTVGGIAIPRANSDTLTQDPTASISTFITLTEETTVQVRAFGYASNSSQQDGILRFALDSATFVRIG